MNPCGQTQTPCGEQAAELEQAGEHAADSRSSNVKDDGEEGSCVTSGTESQRMTRPLLEPKETAAHVLDDKASERAVRGVEVLTEGLEGKLEKAA